MNDDRIGDSGESSMRDGRAARRRGRIAALTGATVLAAGAVSLWLSSAQGETPPGMIPPAHAATSLPAALPVEDAEPDNLVAPAPLSKEEKRFRRADRNDDGKIQQSEYLHQRRRNFDKLDRNGDGRLSFEEYAASGIEKFAKADRNGDGILDAPEFASTAVKPRAPTQTASRQCPPCAMVQADPDDQP